MAKDEAKRAAAEWAALELVEAGAFVGLGSGSTALLFVEALGRRIGPQFAIAGAVPSSRTTEAAARAAGLPLVTVEDVVAGGDAGRLSIVVDGADEIDAAFRMIKGGGASLLREKILARLGRRMAVIADASKRVERLGAFPLPVEIVPFGAAATERLVAEALSDLVGRRVAVTQRADGGSPVVTDNANLIVDCALGAIPDPEAVARALEAVPGVVEHGLFLTEASTAVIGEADGMVTVLSRPA